MAKRPWFWGGATVMALEYRELREKDFEAIGGLMRCVNRGQFQKHVDRGDVLVACNEGVAVGFVFRNDPSMAWETIRGRKIAERLKRQVAK